MAFSPQGVALTLRKFGDSVNKFDTIRWREVGAFPIYGWRALVGRGRWGFSVSSVRFNFVIAMSTHVSCRCVLVSVIVVDVSYKE